MSAGQRVYYHDADFDEPRAAWRTSRARPPPSQVDKYKPSRQAQVASHYGLRRHWFDFLPRVSHAATNSYFHGAEGAHQTVDGQLSILYVR